MFSYVMLVFFRSATFWKIVKKGKNWGENKLRLILFKLRVPSPICSILGHFWYYFFQSSYSTYLIALSLLWYLLIQGKMDKWCAKSVKCQHSVWKLGSFHLNDSDLFKVSTHSSASLVVILSLVSSEMLTRDLELY